MRITTRDLRHLLEAVMRRRGIALGPEEVVDVETLETNEGFEETLDIRVWRIRGTGKYAPYKFARRTLSLRLFHPMDTKSIYETLVTTMRTMVLELFPYKAPKGWRLYSRRPR